MNWTDDYDKKSDVDSKLHTADSERFTVNSFTQNLSAVLSDPTRSRAETAAFFTRHWGEHFVPRTHVAPSPDFPRITAEHFRQYLATTGKKHRHYLKVKRALRSASLTRESERSGIDLDEVPTLFLVANFSLRDTHTFEAVFLEPPDAASDSLIAVAQQQRRRASTTAAQQLTTADTTPAVRPLGATRPESSASLTSKASFQDQLAMEASGGRYFRPYQILHNRLEYYHDTVGILLNRQLEAKSEEFWRTVNSYTVLHGELEAAIRDAEKMRSGLRQTDEDICAKSQRLIRLHWERENRRKLLQKLDDIACLRDAQSTVQMLLNQNNFPKALECIETAHEVLDSDLRGVTCFRHLSSQLSEMHDAIARMLHEEFIALVQREFAKAIERETDAGYQESQLQPVLIGLIRCRDFRFLQVLQTEIVEASKNTVRQVILSRFVEFDLQLSGFDPSLGNLGEQITKMTLDQWMNTLKAIFHSLYLLCYRVMSIQELIIECLTIVESLNIRDRRSPSAAPAHTRSVSAPLSLASRVDSNASMAIFEKDTPNREQSAELVNSTESAASCVSPTAAFGLSRDATTKSRVSAASALAVACVDFARLRFVAPRLVEHASISAQDSVGKIIVPKGVLKGGFLDKCNPETFCRVYEMADAFVVQCRTIPQRFRASSDDETRSSQLSDESESDAQAPEHLRLRREGPSDAATKPITALSEDAGGLADSPLRAILQRQAITFVASFHEEKREKLKQILDAERWQPLVEIPSVFQRIVDQFEATGALRDLPRGASAAESTLGSRRSSTASTMASSIDATISTNSSASKPASYIVLNGERFIVIGTALLLMRTLAEYCGLLELFPQRVAELNLYVVEILKQFNSRTCQLILGAGALKIVGLKTISVRNLALSSRSLQLIARFVPTIRTEFAARLPETRHSTLRHFDALLRDYRNHVDEIEQRLLVLMDNHIISALTEWKVEEKTPTPCFQLIVKQIGKFYSGYSAVMPPDQSLSMLLRIHENFKLYFKQHLQARGISPHDSLTYGLASQDFAYYVENMRTFPDCASFPDDSLATVLQRNTGTNMMS